MEQKIKLNSAEVAKNIGNTIEISSVINLTQTEKLVSLGEKCIKLIDKTDGKQIGVIQFNFPKKTDNEKFIQVAFIGVNSDFKGNDLGSLLFERLLEEAEKENLDGIKGDSLLRPGAIASLYKLEKKGYHIDINPDALEKYNDFKEIYEKGENFQDVLRTKSLTGSVFKIFTNKNEARKIAE